jgi:hypothetical protein
MCQYQERAEVCLQAEGLAPGALPNQAPESTRLGQPPVHSRLTLKHSDSLGGRQRKALATRALLMLHTQTYCQIKSNTFYSSHQNSYFEGQQFSL